MSAADTEAPPTDVEMDDAVSDARTMLFGLRIFSNPVEIPYGRDYSIPI